jgi:hypothetical protein
MRLVNKEDVVDEEESAYPRRYAFACLTSKKLLYSAPEQPRT